MSTPFDRDPPVSPSTRAQHLSASAVLDRMKEVYEVDSDTALADALHTTRQNISKWRSRNSIPYTEAVAASYMRNVSIDYILTGRGARDQKQGTAQELDVQLLRAILLSLLAFDRIKIIGGDTIAELNEMAKAIAFQYKRAAEAAQHLQQTDGLNAEAARAVAVAATELISSDGTLFGPRLDPVDRSAGD
ncbi:helix-turn-helix domain-containing protein [Methylobacterium sp. Leaf113]|uniref:helix-turn-helix domain-containing protein n=1 Tax=Methylobacterium sp. Leaf113 TaxID=1736259 RepID=UPI0009EBD254|nr:helix-turn-helix domain-containing protein [Methylobacterium sp. Leaf113]